MATPTTLPATFVAGNVLTAAQMNDLRGAFRVLQVIQTVKTDPFTTTSATFVDITGLSVAITPSATSSKILIVAQLAYSGPVANTSMGFIQLTGGNSGNYVGDTSGSKVRAVFGGYTGSDGGGHDRELLTQSVIYLDSPATTSATTYKVQARGTGASSGTVSINEARGVVNDANSAVGASSITVMEISA